MNRCQREQLDRQPDQTAQSTGNSKPTEPVISPERGPAWRPHRPPRAFWARAILPTVLLGFAMLGCEANPPSFDGGSGSSGLDAEGGDDPRIDFQRVSPPSTQKSIELINTDESFATVEVSLTLTNDPEGKTRQDYKVVWCDEFDLGEGPVNFPLCNDESCNALWGDNLTKGSAKLTIFGTDFELGDEIVTEHTVRAILVDADLFEQSNNRCPDTPKDGFKERLTVDVQVRRQVGGPNTEILPPPHGDCHTAKFALRAKIDALPSFPNANYEVRWYQGDPETGVRIQTLDIIAQNGAVCTGKEALNAATGACFLKTDKFKKGQEIWLTARVLSNGGVSVNGEETTDPAKVQICDGWPDCKGFLLLIRSSDQEIG